DKAHALIKQTPASGTTAVAGAGYRMKVPPGVFRRYPRSPATPSGAAAPLKIGVAVNNPNVLQVRTTLSFSGPGRAVLAATPSKKQGGTMTFHGNARPASKNTVSYAGPNVGSGVSYKSTTGKRFGGPSQTWIKNLGEVGVWADLPDIVIPCQNTKLG